MEKIFLIKKAWATTSKKIKNTTNVLLNFVKNSLSKVHPKKNTWSNKKVAERIPNVKKLKFLDEFTRFFIIVL